MTDATVKLTADISGVQSTFAKFERVAESVGKTASFAFRPFEKNSERVRASLAGVNKEGEEIERRSRVFLELFREQPATVPPTSLAGRLKSSSEWSGVGEKGGAIAGGAIGLLAGPEGLVPGALAGAGVGKVGGGVLGFFAPEIDDSLDFSTPAELEGRLKAAEALKATLASYEETLAAKVAKASIALRPGQFLESENLGRLQDEIVLLNQAVGHFNKRILLNLTQMQQMFEDAPEEVQGNILERIWEEDQGYRLPLKDRKYGTRALGGPVQPGVAFLVGERGPEIFVPDQAGRILPNSILASSGGGGGLLGDDFDAVIAEIDRFGQALDQALEGVPEEVQKIAESVGGTFIQSLEQGRGVMEAMQNAGREAAGQLLHMLLQSEAVRGELGELADVIENVLNQALNGSIDSWEDLGRVALEVLQAIIEKMVEAQQAATKGGGDGGGFLGTIGSLFSSFLGLGGGGGSALAIGSTGGFSSGGGGTIFTNAGAGIGSVGATPSFSFAGGFAGGGPLSAGQMALVGEMGPELFVPKVPGHVIPNGALGGGGGNTFINNIYAPGANAEGLQEVRDELRLQRHAIERVDRSVESRAIAEVWRQADRGGNFARSVGRRRD